MDRSLDDIIKKNRESRGTKGTRSLKPRQYRSMPYDVQRRRSANAVPTAPKGDSDGPWEHDLFKASFANDAKNLPKEEIVQFPPKRYTQKEKDQLLKTNPLFQRLDAPKPKETLPTPLFPSVPTAPAAMSSQPPRNLKTNPPSISIAGVATAGVIISNLAPTVSVEDIKATLANIGGGVTEVHIISSTGQGLKARVQFRKAADGAKDCVAKFHGVKADGRTISVTYENVASLTTSKPVSFLNHQPATQLAERSSRKQRPRKNANATDSFSGSEMEVEPPQGPLLYSDRIVLKGRGARMAGAM